MQGEALELRRWLRLLQESRRPRERPRERRQWMREKRPDEKLGVAPRRS